MGNNPVFYNDVNGDSIPATFTGRNGKELSTMPTELAKHFAQEYGVKVGYNSKSHMLYYDGEAEKTEKVSKSAKDILVSALKDTETGWRAIKKYGENNFGYDMKTSIGGDLRKITQGVTSKTASIFMHGFRIFRFRETFIDLDDFDFANQGKSRFAIYQNVEMRAFNFARVFEHEWMGTYY